MKDVRGANKVDAVVFFSPVAGRTASDELSLLDKDWMRLTLSDFASQMRTLRGFHLLRLNRSGIPMTTRLD